MSIVEQSTKTAEVVADAVQSVAEGVVDLASDSVDAVASLTGQKRNTKRWAWLAIVAVVLAAVAFARSRQGQNDEAEHDDVRPVRAA